MVDEQEYEKLKNRVAMLEKIVDAWKEQAKLAKEEKEKILEQFSSNAKTLSENAKTLELTTLSFISAGRANFRLAEEKHNLMTAIAIKGLEMRLINNS
jgi:cytochrome c556